MRKRETIRVKSNTIVPRYLQKDGSWGDYKTARTFSSQQAAETYMAKHKPQIEHYGLS